MEKSSRMTSDDADADDNTSHHQDSKRPWEGGEKRSSSTDAEKASSASHGDDERMETPVVGSISNVSFGEQVLAETGDAANSAPAAAAAMPLGTAHMAAEAITAETVKNMTDEQIIQAVQSAAFDGDPLGIVPAFQNVLQEICMHTQDPAERLRSFHLNARVSTELILGGSANNVNRQPLLGSRMPSLGFGSSAGKHKKSVDEVLQSHSETSPDKKGGMLCHHFYRTFLQFVQTPPASNDTTSNDFKTFKKLYQLIWKKTDFGIAAAKNKSNEKTPEPNVSALLAAVVNQLEELKSGKLVWLSEYQHFRKRKEKSKPLKTTENDTVMKPRTDGMLLACDPQHQDALRPLVSIEVKLGSFADEDKWQSRSNAADAFSLRPLGECSWPLLAFRCSLFGEDQVRVDVLTVVPFTEAKARNVRLWQASGGVDELYRPIVAALKAANDFVEQLSQRCKPFLFGIVHRNIVIQEDEKVVFKAFLNSERPEHLKRRVNLNLIKEFVDPDAVEVMIGTLGYYVKMKDVGEILPSPTFECDAARFADIASDLRKLHAMGYCHGDIRLSNLILAASVGKLIDFDLAGITSEQTYPASLNSVVDGERHPDVQVAIQNETVETLTLETCHDWHSLRAVMKCFLPKDSKHQTKWDQYVGRIQDCPQPMTFNFKVVLRKEKRGDLGSTPAN